MLWVVQIYEFWHQHTCFRLSNTFPFNTINNHAKSQKEIKCIHSFTHCIYLFMHSLMGVCKDCNLMDLTTFLTLGKFTYLWCPFFFSITKIYYMVLLVRPGMFSIREWQSFLASSWANIILYSVRLIGSCVFYSFIGR